MGKWKGKNSGVDSALNSKREKNREAAVKCRKNKKEEIEKLKTKYLEALQKIDTTLTSLQNKDIQQVYTKKVEAIKKLFTTKEELFLLCNSIYIRQKKNNVPRESTSKEEYRKQFNILNAKKHREKKSVEENILNKKSNYFEALTSLLPKIESDFAENLNQKLVTLQYELIDLIKYYYETAKSISTQSHSDSVTKEKNRILYIIWRLGLSVPQEILTEFLIQRPADPIKITYGNVTGGPPSQEVFKLLNNLERRPPEKKSFCEEEEENHLINSFLNPEFFQPTTPHNTEKDSNSSSADDDDRSLLHFYAESRKRKQPDNPSHSADHEPSRKHNRFY